MHNGLRHGHVEVFLTKFAEASAEVMVTGSPAPFQSSLRLKVP
jgi:hypothetical protein